MKKGLLLKNEEPRVLVKLVSYASYAILAIIVFIFSYTITRILVKCSGIE